MARNKDQDQQSRRTIAVYEDQHGREWVVFLHRETMTPVGPMFLRSCREPVPTPQKYVRIDPTRMGRIRVQYDQWINDLRASQAWRSDRLMQVAEKMYGTVAATMMRDQPAELLAKLGPESVPVEFVYAMRSGESKWALGMRRPDGSFYPRPKWVTDVMFGKLEAALRQSWTPDDEDVAVADLFAPGTFADDEPDAPVTADADEEEAPAFLAAASDVVPPVTVIPGTITPATITVQPSAPVRRGPGRPRKQPQLAG